MSLRNLIKVDLISYPVKQGENRVKYLEINAGDKIGIVDIDGTSKFLNILVKYIAQSERISLKPSSFTNDIAAYPYLTGRDYLYQLGILSNMDEIEIENKILILTNTFEFYSLHKKILSFTRPMLHRLMIIGSLINSPSIAIFDGINNILDNKSKHLLRQYFINNKNITCLISCSVLEDVNDICNKIVVLRKGEIEVI